MANPSFDELMHFNPYHDNKNGQFTFAPVWGSKEHQFESSRDFLAKVNELRETLPEYTDPKTGNTYTGDMAVAKSLGMNSTQFRTQLSLANNERSTQLPTASPQYSHV